MLILPLATHAQEGGGGAESRPAAEWTVSMTGTYANTFQLILGDRFGNGPDFQDRLTAGVDNAFRAGDNISMFGWSTTDISSVTPNWQAGVLYKTPIWRCHRHALFVTVGGQRWVLPLVGTGAKDWMTTSNLTYKTSVAGVPVFVSEDAYNLLQSTLPTGSALYSQVYTQHKLFNARGISLSLRQGPAYSHSWGFYGIEGDRVVRYGATVVASWKGMVVEGGYRKQFGLQDRIPNNGYWTFSVTRKASGRV
jgi:hypothetical protein